MDGAGIGMSSGAAGGGISSAEEGYICTYSTVALRSCRLVGSLATHMAMML